MSIYNRDEIFPEWEPAPWPMSARKADKQERGFHKRALMPIQWHAIPWNSFPADGIFGNARDWLISRDVSYFATHDDEDLLLINNVWSGWPDPPEWGLVSRPSNQAAAKWQHWGHFPELPTPWSLPKEIPASGAADWTRRNSA